MNTTLAQKNALKCGCKTRRQPHAPYHRPMGINFAEHNVRNTNEERAPKQSQPNTNETEQQEHFTSNPSSNNKEGLLDCTCLRTPEINEIDRRTTPSTEITPPPRHAYYHIECKTKGWFQEIITPQASISQQFRPDCPKPPPDKSLQHQHQKQRTTNTNPPQPTQAERDHRRTTNT